MVPPPPGRHAQVRREPAEALPGHLQPRLRLRGLARAVAGAARRRALLGRARRPHLPRRQPAHQAARVLGVADRGGSRARAGHVFLAEAFTRARDDERAGARSASASPTPTSPGRTRSGELREYVERPGQQADPRVPPPELLRQHARHPQRVPAARRTARVRGRGSCSPRRSRRATGSTRGSRRSSDAASARARRSTSTRRSTSSRQRTLDGPLLPLPWRG